MNWSSETRKKNEAYPKSQMSRNLHKLDKLYGMVFKSRKRTLRRF